ncbi:hypothetical protein KP509_01G040600 [Ceratopteris richardii]|uniref:Secreted protein n=1 Tax=Ceratopteris richardii TaxID=49495 RepID=A0A8T2VKL0_CERRI|nr:hypothetical protein KP509_01G040600 [Ceratopteris richardii]
MFVAFSPIWRRCSMLLLCSDICFSDSQMWVLHSVMMMSAHMVRRDSQQEPIMNFPFWGTMSQVLSTQQDTKSALYMLVLVHPHQSGSLMDAKAGGALSI